MNVKRNPCLCSVAMIGELPYMEPFHWINKAGAELKRLGTKDKKDLFIFLGRKG